MDPIVRSTIARQITPHEATLIELLQPTKRTPEQEAEIVSLITQFTFGGDPARRLAAAITSADKASNQLNYLLMAFPYSKRITLLEILRTRLEHEAADETAELLDAEQWDEVSELHRLMALEVWTLGFCADLPEDLSLVRLHEVIPQRSWAQTMDLLNTILDVAQRPVIRWNAMGRGYEEIPLRIAETDFSLVARMRDECHARGADIPLRMPGEDAARTPDMPRIDFRGAGADISILYKALKHAGYLGPKVYYSTFASHFDYGSTAKDMAGALRKANSRVEDGSLHPTREMFRKLVDYLKARHR